MMVSRSCGPLCPRSVFEGRVHSVFSRAVNVQVDGFAHGLISVLDHSLPATPTSFQCDLSLAGSRRPNVSVGARVWMRGGVIRFESGWPGSIFTAGAEVWLPAPVMGERNPQRLQRNLEMAQWWFLEACRNRLSLTRASAGDYLNKALLAMPEHLETCPERLFDNIGRGQGLTPSGDDCLVGVLAAIWTMRSSWPEAERLWQRLSDYHGFDRAKTTDISAHYLELAFGGHFSQPVQWLVYRLMAGEDPSILESAVAAVMNAGASSGADTCAGILYAMQQLSSFTEPVLKAEPAQHPAVN